MLLRNLGSFVVAVTMAAPAFAAQVVDVVELDAPPVRLAYRAPLFPAGLDGTATEGNVSLSLVVDRDGSIRTVEEVKATLPEFARAARDAVLQWRFKPGEVGGVPTAYRLPVMVALRPAEQTGALDAVALPGTDASIIAEPTVEYEVPPAYPAELVGEPRDGLAMVNVMVDAAGTPSDAVVEFASHPAFAAAASAAVLTWRFAPAERQGHLVTARTLALVRFRKDDVGLSTADRRRLAQLSKARDYDVAPEAVLQVPLVYPFDAMVQKERGVVTLNLLISPEGQVVNIVPDPGSSNDFGLAAAACVTCWTFNPATKFDQPVFGWVKWQIVFGDESGELQFDDAARDLLDALRHGTLQLTPGRELDQPITPRERVTLKLPPNTPGASVAGDAVIEVIIDGEGRVRFPRIVKASVPEIGYAAATAALRWRFAPPRKAGEPVAVRVQIPFRIAAATPASAETR